MTRRRVLMLGWLLVLGLSATLPISAVAQGILHFGPGTIRESKPLDHPLIAIGSDVDLAGGTQSHAVVVDIMGSVHVSGPASDDVVAIDGPVYLRPDSRVSGDIVTILGAIYQAPGARATGRLGGVLHPWDGHSSVQSHNLESVLGNSIRLGLAAGLALVLAGACLTIVFPWQIVLISTTLRSSPVKSLAAGAMILLTFVFLVVPLGLSLAGLPFALLLTAAAVLAWLFGMAAAAVVVGRIVAHGPVSLLWAAAAGLFSLAAVMAIPFLGPLLVTMTGLTGAGALAVALLSRARPATPLP